MESANEANDVIEILIAEDSPTQSAQLIHLLEQRGYAVSAARNGREALLLLDQSQPALVITDVVMPEMDGYGLCRAIKSDARWKHIPVILVTTLSDAADVIRGLECGADNFIRKPYEERYLLSRIDYLLMNLNMRKNQRMQMGVEINLGNQRHFITSERQQILDLLISTYEQAVHINNDLMQREKELGQANQVLNGLYRIAEALNHACTERAVVELALERALELPGIQAGWIFLCENGSDSIRLAVSRNVPPALTEEGATDGACRCRQLCGDAALEPVTNIYECERLQNATADTKALRGHAAIPLRLGDRALGVMNLAGPDEGLFPEHELKNLSNIGNQIAVALDRTRLLDRLETMVEERTAKLHESEERYRLLFDRNPHPTWVYDLETLAFLAVNDAAVAHYGYSREELLRMTLVDIRPSEEVPALLRVLKEEPESPRPRSYGVFKHRTKSGKIIEVEIASSEIAFSGRRAGLVLAVDVTEKRRLEQQFLRAQRLESIGALAGGISHDLNNLLMPITIGVSFLKRGETSERRLRALENIERSAKRGGELVKQVLSFARGIEGSRVPVQLSNLIREMESIVESTFPKNMSMRLDVSPDLWWIDGDPTQLEQVLMNLCVNARDAMPRGGRLCIVAKNVEIDEHYAGMNHGMTAGRYVAVEVMDEGHGMPAEVRERIFEPFFTTKESGRGTGLGLSTAAAIVRGHGGFVNVYSEVGRGTSFKVYLPAQSNTEITKDGAGEEPVDLPRGNGETILVVDDESSILAITQQTLEAFGYRILTAEDGARAIGAFAMHRNEIDAIITDMMMPVLDGRAFIAAVRGIDSDVPIIASSGLGETARITEAADAGVDHFLQKPYSAAVLLRTLHDVLA